MSILMHFHFFFLKHEIKNKWMGKHGRALLIRLQSHLITIVNKTFIQVIPNRISSYWRRSTATFVIRSPNDWQRFPDKNLQLQFQLYSIFPVLFSREQNCSDFLAIFSDFRVHQFVFIETNDRAIFDRRWLLKTPRFVTCPPFSHSVIVRCAVHVQLSPLLKQDRAWNFDPIDISRPCNINDNFFRLPGDSLTAGFQGSL